MATPEIATLAAAWPAPSAALRVMPDPALHVLSLRHWPGEGSMALAEVLTAQALPTLPQPGRCSGEEHRLVWQRPNETLLLTPNSQLAATLLAALRPQPGALACALDQSSGSLVVALQGMAVDALLMRVVDADAIPRVAGQASRMRLMDIAATVWREAPDSVGLLVDRAHGHYLAQWLRYAAGAL